MSILKQEPHTQCGSTNPIGCRLEKFNKLLSQQAKWRITPTPAGWLACNMALYWIHQNWITGESIDLKDKSCTRYETQNSTTYCCRLNRVSSGSASEIWNDLYRHLLSCAPALLYSLTYFLACIVTNINFQNGCGWFRAIWTTSFRERFLDFSLQPC